MPEMTQKRYKVVFKDGLSEKVAKGFVEDPDADFVKVTGVDGSIYISKKHIVFMREI